MVILYCSYVSVVTATGLEGVCRLGWVPNPAYAQARLCDSWGASRRVLILGDSFSVDFEGSYGRLLTDYFRENGARAVNLAVSGSGPLDYRERLEMCGRRLKPQLVVVNYYVGNDPSDTSNTLGRRTVSRDYLRRAMKATYLGTLVLDIRAGWVEAQKLRALERQQGRPRVDGREILNPFLAAAAVDHPDEILANLLLERPDMQRAWELNRGLLHEMAHLARAAGGRVVIAVLPATTQVSRSHEKFYADLGFRVDERLFHSETPQRLMREFCEEERIVCIDLLPAFRRQQPRRFYLEDDDHWNSDGQMLAFTVVREQIESLGLTP
jgi:hypothetical protein